MSVEQVKTVQQNVKTINTLSCPTDERMLEIIYMNYNPDLEEDVINAYVKYLDSYIWDYEMGFLEEILFENCYKDPKLTEEVKKKIVVIIRPMIINAKKYLLSCMKDLNIFLNIY